MNKQLPCFIFVVFLLAAFPLSAQAQTEQPRAFWISPGAEIALYSPVNLSYGGGIAIAYGKGTSIGIKVSWLFDHEGQLSLLEFDFLLRFYFFGDSANSGLFIQFAGGPAIYFLREENISLPAKIGTPTAGLSLGWRFLLGKTFYIEPSIRGGYPFIAGASLSAGVHF